MTKHLEELFSLNPIDQTTEPPVDTDQVTTSITTTQESIKAIDEAIDKIDAALPTVRDLDASDQEMDDLATLAKDSFESMMDLALNVEPRFSGPILQSASTLLGHAITAKMAKMDKKLKMVDLQLKKARLDQQANKETSSAASVDGTGVILDRNELLRSILAEKLNK